MHTRIACDGSPWCTTRSRSKPAKTRLAVAITAVSVVPWRELAASKTPLMVDTETGVRAMVAAIEKEKAQAFVPAWPWVPLVAMLKVLPPRFTKPFA